MRQLPPRPSLEHLKKQAKELLEAIRAGDPDSIGLYRSAFPAQETPNLARAQLALARDYGFPSWTALKRAVEGNQLDDFVSDVLGGRLDAAKKLLPKIKDQIPADLVASAITGQVENVMEKVRQDPKLLNDRVGKLERPLLTYVCFSRLVSDPDFARGIRELGKQLLDVGADPNSYF